MVHADTIDSVVMAWPGFIAAAGVFRKPDADGYARNDCCNGLLDGFRGRFRRRS